MSEELATNQFDYSSLDSDVAIEARVAAERIKMRLRRSAEDVIAIGLDLTKTKEKLGHGRYLDWLKCEFEMSESTALNFIRVANKFGGKSVNFADLKPSILYALASAPEPVQQEVIQRSANGEKLTVKEVEELKRKVKAEEDLRIQREKQVKELNKQLQGMEAGLIESEADRKTLADRVTELENQLKTTQQTIVEKEKIVEVLPPGYTSLQQMENELKQAQQELSRFDELRRSQQAEIEELRASRLQELEQEFEAKKAQLQSEYEKERERQEKETKRTRQRAEAAKKDLERQDAKFSKVAHMNEKLSEARVVFQTCHEHAIATTQVLVHVKRMVDEGYVTPEWYHSNQADLATLKEAIASLELALSQQAESFHKQEPDFIDVKAS